MDGFDARVAAIAAGQHCLITLAQIRQLGGTHRMVECRLRSGIWRRVHRGVFFIAGHPFTWETKVMANVLAGGPGTLASHRAGLVLWDLDGFRPGRPEVSVPRHHKPRHLDACVHESTDLELADPVRRHGIPTTGLVRTLLDVGCLIGFDRLEAAAHQVVRETGNEWPDLYGALVRHSRRGRDGCGWFRAVLDENYGDQVVTDSRFEKLVRRLLLDDGIDEPESQFRVFDGDCFVAELDLAWPRWQVAVELQSKKHHLNPEAFERDKRRLNACRLLGWNVLEYTWRFYVEHPDRLCAEIAQALATAKLR